MKTLSVKATALLLAPMIALTSLAPAYAESVRTDELSGTSLGHAYHTNLVIKGLIGLAEQTVQPKMTDADREKALDGMSAIVSKFSVTERIEMLDMLIEALPKIEAGSKKKSAIEAGLVVGILVLAAVALDTGFKSKGSTAAYTTIAFLVGSGVFSGIGLHSARRRYIEVPKNIEDLRLGLIDLREANLNELKVERLK